MYVQMMAADSPSSESPEGQIPYPVYIGLIIAVLVLAGVTFLSWVVELVDSWALHHRHIAEILQRSYRELALLGLIALVLFIVEQAHAIANETALLELEYIHIGIFSVVAVYLVYTAVNLFLSRRISERWRAIESTYVNQFFKYKELKQQLVDDQRVLRLSIPEPLDPFAPANGNNTIQRDRKAAAGLLRALCHHPARTIEYYRRVGLARYLEQRQRFLVRHSDMLPPDFKFSSYLTLCKQHCFIRLVDIRPSLWITLAWLLILDLYLRSIWPWYRATFKATPIIVAISIFTVTLSLTVWLKMKHVHWSLMHSEFARIQVRQEAVQAAETWEDIGQSLSMRSFASFRMMASQRAPQASDTGSLGIGSAAAPTSTGAICQTAATEAAPLSATEPVAARRRPVAGSTRQDGAGGHDARLGAPLPPTTQLVPIMAGQPGEEGEMIMVPVREALAHGRMPTLIEPLGEVEVQALTDEEYRKLHRRHLDEQQRLFWFRKPVLILSLLQLSFFLNALSVSLIVILWKDVTSSLNNILWTFLTLAATILATIFLLGEVVPLYVLSIHTSDLVDVRLLAEAVIRHERHKRRTARQLAAARPGSQASKVAAIKAAGGQRHHGWLRIQLAIGLSMLASLLRPGKGFVSRIRAAALWLVYTYEARLTVTLLILLEVFLLAIIASTYIRQPERTIILAFTIAIVGIIALELAVRIWATGVVTFFTYRPALFWNVADVVIVVAAIVAVVIGFAFGNITVNPGSGNQQVTVTGAPLYVGGLLALRLLRGAFIGGAQTHLPRPTSAPAAAGGAAAGSGGGGGPEAIGRQDTRADLIKRQESEAYPPSLHYAPGGLGQATLGRMLGEAPPQSLRVRAPLQPARARARVTATGAASAQEPSAAAAAGVEELELARLLPSLQAGSMRGVSVRRSALPPEFMSPAAAAAAGAQTAPSSPACIVTTPGSVLGEGGADAAPASPAAAEREALSVTVLEPIIEEQGMIDEAAIEQILEGAEEGMVPPMEAVPAETSTPSGGSRGEGLNEFAAEEAPAGAAAPLNALSSDVSLQLGGETSSAAAVEAELEEHGRALEAYGLHGGGGGGRHRINQSDLMDEREIVREMISRARSARVRGQPQPSPAAAAGVGGALGSIPSPTLEEALEGGTAQQRLQLHAMADTGLSLQLTEPASSLTAGAPAGEESEGGPEEGDES